MEWIFRVMQNILHGRKQIPLAKCKIVVSVFLKVIDGEGWWDQILVFQRKLLLQAGAMNDDVGSSVVCNMLAREKKAGDCSVGEGT